MVVGALAFSVAASGALVGCGSSASLAFAMDPPATMDAGEPPPYPDAATDDLEATVAADASPTGVPTTPPCAPGKDGKANVCVRVLRGADGPSIAADSKASWGLDGHGAVLIGLAAVMPSARNVAFVAQTWLPSESSGAGKLAVSELPKLVEMSVPPGAYWAFAVFRDQEPYMRPGLAIGDYVPRLVELPMVNVVAGDGLHVDVKLYPVRAIDVEVRATATPVGSGTGPARLWLVDDKKNVLGEGGAPCLDLSGGRAEVVRLFTTYTGPMEIAGALFDYGAVGDDGSGKLPLLPPGTLHVGPAGNAAAVAVGDWLAPVRRKLDLDKVVPLTTKPVDPSPDCVADPYVAPK